MVPRAEPGTARCQEACSHALVCVLYVCSRSAVCGCRLGDREERSVITAASSLLEKLRIGVFLRVLFAVSVVAVSHFSNNKEILIKGKGKGY